MGKVTGFLEIDRQDRKYLPAADRVRNYDEFVIPLDEGNVRSQAARCMDCGIPYCHTGCPVNNQIPDWNDLVYHDDWEEAARNLHSTNNFPEVTGRICPAPCEASCTLNLEDAPVTIKTIECAIVDKAFEQGWVQPQPPAEKTGKSVAIVGSGPAGMAAAQQLARTGHDVHVFEKHARPGGLMVTASRISKWKNGLSRAAWSRWKLKASPSTATCMWVSTRKPPNWKQSTTPFCSPVVPNIHATCPSKDAIWTACISPWSSCRSKIGALLMSRSVMSSRSLRTASMSS